MSAKTPSQTRDQTLAGVVALVTGAASGLGAAIVDANHDGAEEVADRISNGGGEALALSGDVTDRDAVRQWLAVVRARWSPVTVLVNCAGIFAPTPARDLTPEEWQRTLDVNVTGTFNTCQLAGLEMLELRRGSIINLTSISGVRGFRGRTAYATSKHAVIGLTRVLACEWAAAGVRVNAIGPGRFNTPMNVNANLMTEQAFMDRVPMARFAEPDEITGTAVFLASEMSSYVTGQVVFVDGGFLVG
jgi:3-oxoacyl-[acyl-carrier protein] reductase